MNKFVPGVGALIATAVVLSLLTGCGGGGSSSSTGQSSEATEATEAATGEATEGTGSAGESGSVLGSPKAATGKPIVFGMLNLENGPVTFPQVHEGAQAAAEYVNEYLGGIHGRPIKIVNCATDGQPSTSTRCANQIAEEEPLAILGAVDTGATGSIPIWERKGLAYLGGISFGTVESNSKDAAIFVALGLADNAAAAAYAADPLGLKSAVVLQTSDTQGKYTGSVIKASLEAAGLEAKTINVAPTAADLASPAAEAVSSNPDLIYVEVPNACPAMLKALQSVGSTATLMGIGTCVSAQAIEAAGSAAEGIYYAEPFEPLDGESEQAKITSAAFEKYLGAETPQEETTVAAFGTVMNVYEKLNEAPASVLEEPSAILSLFTEGSENPNWMAHPYTCDRKQVAIQAAVCNADQILYQVKGEKLVRISEGWVNGAKFLPTE